ncbi:hypothetical protein GCM10011411_15680 [Aurantiacibacter arachoides]|nr:hypothetical protein GCM10011411_15680 [Aurantiacibacter arachoides]
MGLWAVYLALQIAMAVVFFTVIGGSFALAGVMGDSPFAAMGVGAILMIVLFYVAYLLLSFATSVSLTHQASPLHSPALTQSFGAGLRSMLTLFGLLVVFFVGYFAVTLILTLLVGALSRAGDAAAFIGVAASLVLILYLLCRLAVVFPIIAVEGERNPLSAIARSWRLTSGNAMRIFVAMLVFFVLLVAAVGVLFLIFGGSFAAMASNANGPGDFGAVMGGMAIFFIAFLVISALAAMISSSFMASLHAGLAPARETIATFE